MAISDLPPDSSKKRRRAGVAGWTEAKILMASIKWYQQLARVGGESCVRLGTRIT
jgi:hypothetical protein